MKTLICPEALAFVVPTKPRYMFWVVGAFSGTSKLVELIKGLGSSANSSGLSSGGVVHAPLPANVPAIAPPPPSALNNWLAPGFDANERVIIAGCPVRDGADRVVLATLNRILARDGYRIEIVPGGALVAETIAAVQKITPASILVGSLEESGRARHLVKRLRSVCPDIPIVVGCWGFHASSRLRSDLCAAGADDCATTLAHARNDLIRVTPRPEPTLVDDDVERLGLVAAGREES